MDAEVSLSDGLANYLAENIKQLRTARHLTQNDLARLSRIPRATWANLESGSANPTLNVLTRVAATLQVSIEELIGAPRQACQLFKAADLPIKRRGEAVIRRILPDNLAGIDFERLELPVGVRMGGVPHRTGTREYLTCELGQIELSVTGEKWVLQAGDVIVFRGDQRHSYANVGTKTAVGFSVVLLTPS